MEKLRDASMNETQGGLPGLSTINCDESCGSFADGIMMTISNFPQLEWLKRLHATP
jgi:hypothetical protein